MKSPILKQTMNNITSKITELKLLLKIKKGNYKIDNLKIIVG